MNYDNIDIIIEEFLSECSKFVPDCNSEEYNVFDILNVNYSETKLCRVLADLLNPYGKHKQGDLYLKSFILDVLKISYNESVNYYVESEYVTNNKRRIDIVIYNESQFIPIEVKINANDRDKQCYDYFVFANEKNVNNKFVTYITKHGYMPSLSSKGNLKEDQIKCLSFEKDITNWLKATIERTDDKKGNRVNSVLEQYIQIIEWFCIKGDEKNNMDIVKKICEKEDYFKAAYVISKNFESAKENAKKILLNDLKKKIEENIGDIKFNIKLEDVGNGSAVDYVIKEFKLSDKKYRLVFRIGIEERLFAGFCIKSEDNKPISLIDENLYNLVKNWFKNPKELAKNMWLYWRYLPNGEKKDDFVPNFKELNSSAIKTIDEKYRKMFVANSFIDIKNMLAEIRSDNL